MGSSNRLEGRPARSREGSASSAATNASSTSECSLMAVGRRLTGGREQRIGGEIAVVAGRALARRQDRGHRLQRPGHVAARSVVVRTGLDVDQLAGNQRHQPRPRVVRKPLLIVFGHGEAATDTHRFDVHQPHAAADRGPRDRVCRFVACAALRRPQAALARTRTGSRYSHTGQCGHRSGLPTTSPQQWPRDQLPGDVEPA